MVKFKKKPVVIEATQWFQNGDHPEDEAMNLITGPQGAGVVENEGKIVRYYRTPKMDGQHKCMYCNDIMHNHGWIDTLKGGHIVCPGDWIITGVAGEHYPCKPKIFEATYESINECPCGTERVAGICPNGHDF